MLLMNGQDLSPSLRGRGLKFYFSCFLINIIIVALFTRAWIEIVPSMAITTTSAVALFTRAWIEMLIGKGDLFAWIGRPLYEGVD